MTILYKVNLST